MTQELFKLPSTLEWVQDAFDDSCEAQILFGELCIEPDIDDRWKIELYFVYGDRRRTMFVGVIEDSLDTIDEAKEKAEQWYRERLSSALIPATPNEIAESFFALPVESVTIDMPSLGGILSVEQCLSQAADGHIPSQRSFENRSDPNRQDRSPPMTQELSPEEVLALAEKATESDWEKVTSLDVYAAVVCPGKCTIAIDFENEHDADFVVAARPNWPRHCRER